MCVYREFDFFGISRLVLSDNFILIISEIYEFVEGVEFLFWVNKIFFVIVKVLFNIINVIKVL